MTLDDATKMIEFIRENPDKALETIGGGEAIIALATVLVAIQGERA